MTHARWDRIKKVFNAALAVPPADRPALIARLCDGDDDLRREVESLHEARTLSIVRTGGAADALAGITTASIPDPHAADRVGTTVHRYKLLQLIGEGGFGTVYLAEQTEPVRRKVALKVIKPGMDSRAIVARFEAERQALAMMDHPNIARVLDGGVTPLTESGGGLPFFVMEYVVGDPITKFADAHALSIGDRLGLFQQVCSAVQHAHTKGVIHRDLKPGNVIVSMVDGKPFAKVIDFGIAKATGAAGGRLTDKTVFTEHRMLLGTPEYMSPEQAEGSPDIDTRTDVYALGVLLYELLTGTTPIEGERLRSAAWDEMRRMIRDEEPPAPSMKLSRSLETLARTAAARKAEPSRLSAMVKGELDWIVMKALEKERARRYETASALADDVKRHLAGEPVFAAPVSRAYRVRKFVRKNKGAVGAVSAVMLALAAGGSAAAWQWREAQGAINAKNARDADIAQTLARVQSRLSGGDPDARLGWVTRQSPDGTIDFGVEIVTTPITEEPRIARPASLDAGDERLKMLATLAADSVEKLASQRDQAAEGVGRMNSILQGWDGGPLKGTLADGTSLAEKDPLGWAIDNGLLFAESLKAERDKLASQTDAAKTALSEMFLAGALSTPRMDSGLPAIPEIRGELGVKLLPALVGKGTDADPHRFEFQKLDVASQKVMPIADDQLIPALADSAKETLKRALEATDAAEWSAYTANLALAQAAMSAKDYPSARATVARFPKSRTGWEGIAVSRRAEEVVWATDAGPNGAYRASFGPDPETAALPSFAGVRWIDWRTGLNTKLQLPAVGGSYAVRSNAAGDRLVAAQVNPSGQLTWFARTPSGWTESRLRDDSPADISWSRCGSRFAAAHYGMATVWDATDGRPVRSLPHTRSGASTVALSPDGSILATQIDSDVVLWNVDTGSELVRLSCQASYGWDNNPVFAPDGVTLLTSGRSLREWHTKTGQLLREWPVFGSRAEFVAEAEWCIVSGGNDVSLVDLRTGMVERGLAGGTVPWDQAVNAAISPDGKYVLVTMFGERIVGHDGSAELRRVDQLVPSYFSVQGGSTSRASSASSGLTRRDRISLRLDAILASSPNGPSGLVLTTPDGTRRIVGGVGGDKTVRFYEANDGKPTLPATAESPEGVYREVAVFRMDDAVTNLQMTGDGTRLIIHLQDGSARVWDIRDPEERRKDLQAEWAERVPAGAYLDTLWASDTPNDKLRDAVINDASLTPLRRLVAAEMLEERWEDDRLAAGEAFEAITRDQTDKAAVQAAAVAADLPWRVKARVVESAAKWVHRIPEPSDAERLAEETKQRRLAEATLTVERFQSWDTPHYPGDLADLERAVATRDELLGEAHADSAKARWMLGIYRFAKGKDVDAARGGLALMRRALSEYRAASPLSDVTLGMQLSLAQAEFWIGNMAEAEAMIRAALEEIEADGRAEVPKFALKFSVVDAGGSGFQPGFHGKRLLLETLSTYRYDQPLGVNRARMTEELRQILDAGLVESTMYLGTWIGLVTGPEKEHLSGSGGSESLSRLIPNDARVYLPLALHRYRESRVADALSAAQQSIRLCTATPPAPSELRPNRCDPLLQQGVLALIRHTLSTADDATLAAAAETDGQPNSLTGGKVLDREGHRAAARDALAKARALMSPAPDGTPSPWANDENAKALLAEAEAVVASGESRR